MVAVREEADAAAGVLDLRGGASCLYIWVPPVGAKESGRYVGRGRSEGRLFRMF
jgi:hypothetical protein